ncbi:MAG: adventurous gliding motility protein CglE [Bdellovibrionota bacterium]|nr:adventurous gliding motility protein CglE [Deltaproteobacteria bacterium]
MKQLSIFFLLITISMAASADQIFGDFKRPKNDIERGFSASADMGMFNITGERRTATNPGFQMSLNLGVDINKSVSIEAVNVLGINEADPFDSALQGGVNTFMHELTAKYQYPRTRMQPFVQAGGGVFYSKPGFNFDNDSYKLTMMFAGGLEYYTYLRHYSIYVKSIYHIIMDAPFNAWSLSAGLKYTF